MKYERSKYWALVIERVLKNGCVLDSDKIVSVLNIITSKYFLILHDKDNTREHYHCVIILENALSLRKLLLLLSSCLDVDSSVITATISINLKYDLLYLCHSLDKDSDKYQYSINDIITNDIDFYKIMTCDNKIYNLTELIKICKSSRSITDVIKIIGLDYFEKHSRLITQLFNDSKLFNE